MPQNEDAKALNDYISATIGDREWIRPDGYPNSLALCVIDSVWSLGVNYTSVENVIERYRELRKSADANADVDGVTELVHTFRAIGDPAAVADRLRNHQLTSTRNGMLKSQAVLEVAELLRSQEIETPEDLRGVSLDEQRSDELKSAWRSIRGQTSGLSLTYCRMLAGASDAKADRMLIGYVGTALERDVSSDEARKLVNEVASAISVNATDLDHMIWRYHSGRLD